MSESIEKFDPARLMDGVRDRIRATFVSLIPDDHWDMMVKKEIDDFFRQRNDGGYRNQVSYSNFGLVVSQELEKIVKVKVAKELAVYQNSVWHGDGIVMSDALKDLLEKNAASIFTNMLGQMMQQVITNMRNR